MTDSYGYMIRIQGIFFCVDKDNQGDRGSETSELWKQELSGVGVWGEATSVII